MDRGFCGLLFIDELVHVLMYDGILRAVNENCVVGSIYA